MNIVYVTRNNRCRVQKISNRQYRIHVNEDGEWQDTSGVVPTQTSLVRAKKCARFWAGC